MAIASSRLPAWLSFERDAYLEGTRIVLGSLILFAAFFIPVEWRALEYNAYLGPGFVVVLYVRLCPTSSGESVLLSVLLALGTLVVTAGFSFVLFITSAALPSSFEPSTTKVCHDRFALYFCPVDFRYG
jgi:hypothetical protein